MKPDYYDEFQCIADACSLTCCQEWKIAVDRKTAAEWKKIETPEGVRPKRRTLSDYTKKCQRIKLMWQYLKHVLKMFFIVS